MLLAQAEPVQPVRLHRVKRFPRAFGYVFRFTLEASLGRNGNVSKKMHGAPQSHITFPGTLCPNAAEGTQTSLRNCEPSASAPSVGCAA